MKLAVTLLNIAGICALVWVQPDRTAKTSSRLWRNWQHWLVSLAIEVGVFKMLDTHYRFPYSAKVIKTLIQQAGGKTRSLQRFHKNKDLSQAYERALLSQSKIDANSKPLPHEPPETVPRRCWEIPAQLVMDYIPLDEPSTPPTLAGEFWQFIDA